MNNNTFRKRPTYVDIAGVVKKLLVKGDDIEPRIIKDFDTWVTPSDPSGVYFGYAYGAVTNAPPDYSPQYGAVSIGRKIQTEGQPYYISQDIMVFDMFGGVEHRPRRYTKVMGSNTFGLIAESLPKQTVTSNIAPLATGSSSGTWYVSVGLLVNNEAVILSALVVDVFLRMSKDYNILDSFYDPVGNCTYALTDNPSQQRYTVERYLGTTGARDTTYTAPNTLQWKIKKLNNDER